MARSAAALLCASACRPSAAAPRIASACRSIAERSGCAVPLPVLRPLPEGVTAARQRWFGASTSWYLVWFTRGLGTSAARRAMKSKGSKTTCVVPSRYGGGLRAPEPGLVREVGSTATSSASRQGGTRANAS
jgi:hypothetical protein